MSWKRKLSYWLICQKKSQSNGIFEFIQKVPDPCEVFELTARTSMFAIKKDPERYFLVLLSFLPQYARKKSPKL